MASYNAEGLGAPDAEPGLPERESWDALVAVLRRLDAELVLLQEISGADEVALVPRLAAEAGFAHHAVSDISGTLSGGLRTACLSRLPLLGSRSWTAAALSEAFGGVAEPPANDVGRDLFAVLADAGGPSPWLAFSLHLKSGGASSDRFRRQVEALRLLQAIELELEEAPGARVVLAGDFNEDPRDPPSGESWSELPPGLPASYQLGSDLVLPIEHDLFGTLAAAGFALLEAGREDEPGIVLTRPQSGRRLDLLWIDAEAGACGTEVYEACADDGVDGGSWGDWLPKAGEPLDCGLTELAADHLPVLADLRRLPDDRAPASLGASLRVVDGRAAGAATVAATLDWSADPAAPRPPREHFHVHRGDSPEALLRVDGEEGLRVTSWIDETPRSASRRVHYLEVRAADHCEVESR